MEKSQGNPLLDALHDDIAGIGPTMRQFAASVLQEGVSRYPVFIAAGHPVSIGRPFADKETLGLHFYYHASVIEEFVQKGIVQKERLDDFRQAFGDPGERACIFLVMPEEATFVFVPYETEN